MIYNFKTTDDTQYVVDTEALTWARASSIISAPSVKAAETNLAHFVPSEEGKLIPLGTGRYAFEGRKPFDAQHKPQLAIITLLPIYSGDNEGTAVLFMQANVEIKDGQHQQIKHFHVQCLPPFQLNPAARPMQAS